MSLRLAVRGLILMDNRLLMVNAWPGGKSDLLCAPGGGVEPHSSLPDNLAREVHEETGLTVTVGPLALVNEFHDPDRDFHQVEMFFRCTLVSGDPYGEWTDPEGIVTERHWLLRQELEMKRFKPSSLPDVVWADGPAHYDPLETILR